MTLPKIIDNSRKSMSELLKEISHSHSEVSIATGYWDLEAIGIVVEEFDSLNKIRLLIGREPTIPCHNLFVPESDFPENDFKFDLKPSSPSTGKYAHLIILL